MVNELNKKVMKNIIYCENIAIVKNESEGERFESLSSWLQKNKFSHLEGVELYELGEQSIKPIYISKHHFYADKLSEIQRDIKEDTRKRTRGHFRFLGVDSVDAVEGTWFYTHKTYIKI